MHTFQPGKQRLAGVLKSYYAGDGYGFIVCNRVREATSRDVFLHSRQLPNATELVGQVLSFTVELNSRGMPQARNVRPLDALELVLLWQHLSLTNQTDDDCLRVLPSTWSEVICMGLSRCKEEEQNGVPGLHPGREEIERCEMHDFKHILLLFTKPLKQRHNPVAETRLVHITPALFFQRVAPLVREFGVDYLVLWKMGKEGALNAHSAIFFMNDLLNWVSCSALDFHFGYQCGMPGRVYASRREEIAINVQTLSPDEYFRLQLAQRFAIKGTVCIACSGGAVLELGSTKEFRVTRKMQWLFNILRDRMRVVKGESGGACEILEMHDESMQLVERIDQTRRQSFMTGPIPCMLCGAPSSHRCFDCDRTGHMCSTCVSSHNRSLDHPRIIALDRDNDDSSRLSDSSAESDPQPPKSSRVRSSSLPPPSRRINVPPQIGALDDIVL